MRGLHVVHSSSGLLKRLRGSELPEVCQSAIYELTGMLAVSISPDSTTYLARSLT
jgi:hypothetical protein